MSTHNRYFGGEIRQIFIELHLIESYVLIDRNDVVSD